MICFSSTLGRQMKQAMLCAPVALTNENDGLLLTDGHRKKKAKRSARVALTKENDGLPLTDVLYEVLLRLPAKELCRLRLVCRSWRSLTSDPGFARAHACRHPLLVAWNKTDEVHLLDLSGSIVRQLHVPQRVNDLMSTDLGLLCVSPEVGCLSYVVDPVDGEVVATLPDSANDVDLQEDRSFPSVLRAVPDRASLKWSSPSLLSQVPSTGEYKALRTNGYTTRRDGGLLGPERITQTCNVITVSSATTTIGGWELRWRAQPCPPVGGPPSCLSDSPPSSFRNDNPPSCLRDTVAVNGVVYFLLRGPSSKYSYDDTKYSEDIEPDAIFAFDLAAEEWRPNTIRGPLSSNSDNELKFSRKQESLQLFVLDVCLVMAHHKNWDCSIDLWFLENMKQMLWNKRYSIQCVPGCKGHSSRPPCPLYVLEDGRIVMWGGEKERVLGVYDPRTTLYAKLASMEKYGYVCMHLGSLLCSSGLHGTCKLSYL